MMIVSLKFWVTLVLISWLVGIPTVDKASAVTAEVARKCNELTAKAFPPRVIGNPAAGSAKGDGKAQRDYFKKCIENEGKMDDENQKENPGQK